MTSDEVDVRAGQALIADCPNIELNDIRRNCTCVLEGCQNADIDALDMARDIMSYLNDVVFVESLADKMNITVRQSHQFD